MSTAWALQDAKNRFSELVDKTLAEGSQTVTRRGVPVVVLISAKQYAEMTEAKESVVSFFRKSPLCGIDLDLSRDQDTGREMEL